MELGLLHLLIPIYCGPGAYLFVDLTTEYWWNKPSRVYIQRASHQAQWPPSILRSEPDIKLLASLIKNTAAPRYSSGLLSLPSMFCFGHSVSRSGNLSKSIVTMDVTM